MDKTIQINELTARQILNLLKDTQKYIGHKGLQARLRLAAKTLEDHFLDKEVFQGMYLDSKSDQHLSQ